jgi:PKD repeat protein
VYSPPAASFSYSPTAPGTGTPITFNGSGSSDPDKGVSISSYAWNFGDGTTGSGAKPSHTYTTAGTYTVMLTVTNSVGLSSTTSQQITVDESPTASFTVSPGPHAVGRAITVDGSASNDPDGTISSYAWTFGDGSTTTGATASHAYKSSGTYTITLTVVDSSDRMNTTSQQITVYSPPTASFGFSPPAPDTGTPVGFDASGSSDPDHGVSIGSYAWSFGDGATGSGATPSHTYSRPGNYTVTLTVTNSVGLTASNSEQVTVFPPPPIASFAVTTAHPAAGVPVRFNGSSSSAPQESITSYVWSFGDGSTARGVAASHTYKKAGTYRVTLSITSSSGVSATAVDSLVVVTGGRIKKISTSAKQGSDLLTISLTGPGRLSVGTRRLTIARAETIRVRVTPTATERRLLQSGRDVKVTIRVVFTPRIGRTTKTGVSSTFRG